MVTIPAQLQPPQPRVLTKPPTVEERKLERIKKPVFKEKELTPEQQRLLQEYERAIEQQQISLKNVEGQIVTWEKYLKERQAEQLYYNKLSEEQGINVSDQIRNSLERQETARAHLRELSRVKNELKQGYIVGTEVAEAVRRTERRLTYGERQIETYKREVKEWETAVKQEGWKPIYITKDGMKVPVGIEDPKTKMSVPMQNIPKYLEEKPGERKIIKTPEQRFLEEVGYQAVTTPKGVRYKKEPVVWQGVTLKPISKPSVLSRIQEYVYLEPTPSKFFPVGIGVDVEKITEPARKVSEKVRELPATVFGVGERKDEELFKQEARYYPYARKETAIYEPPKLTEPEKVKVRLMEGEAIIGTKMEQEAKEADKEIFEKGFKEIEDKIKKGEITTQEELDKFVESNEKKIETKRKSFYKELDKKYQKEFDKFQRENFIKYYQAKSKEDFWLKRSGEAISVGLYFLPYVGGVFFASDLIGMPRELRKTKKFVEKYPELYWKVMGEMGISAATYGVASLGIGTIKGIRTQTKVIEAIGKAEAKVKEVGYVIEKNLGKFKFTEKQKLELKQLLDEGYSLKFYETTLKAEKGYEKFTPKVEGKYIEVADRFGNVVGKRVIGELKAELKGKRITREEYIEAVYKIEEKTATGYIEMLDVGVGKPTLRWLKGSEPEVTRIKEPPKLYRFMEEVEVKGVKQLREKELKSVEVEATAKLLGVSKYRGEPMTLSKYGVGFKKGIYYEVLPEFAKLKGEPFSKARMIELQKRVGLKGEIITGEEAGLIRTTAKYITFGEGIAKRVFEKAKKPKEFEWRFLEEIEPKVKVEKPKISKLKEKPPFEPAKPSYVGGVGGEEALGFYSGMGGRIAADFFIPSEPLFKGVTKVGVKEISGKAFGIGLEEGLAKGIKSTTVAVTRLPQKEVEVSVQPVSTRIFTSQLEKEKLKEDPTQSLRTGLLFQQPVRDYQEVAPALRLSQVPIQTQIQKQRQLMKQQQKLRETQMAAPFIPITPYTPFKFRFGFEFPEEEAYRKGQQVGYHAYVKEKGKFKKVSELPMTKRAAKSLGARYVDNTTAATFKIEPITKTKIVKGKKVDEIQVFKGDELQKGDGYFDKIVNKLRDYAVKQGQRTPMKNKWIERQGKRADTSGEQRGLSIAKYKAEQAKRIRGLSTKKKKKSPKNIKGFFGIK